MQVLYFWNLTVKVIAVFGNYCEVIELESEVIRLRHEVEQLRSELSSALRHRRESNELVPLQQAITLFGRTPSIFRDKR